MAAAPAAAHPPSKAPSRGLSPTLASCSTSNVDAQLSLCRNCESLPLLFLPLTYLTLSTIEAAVRGGVII